MADLISVEAVNFKELREALEQAPDLTFRFVKQEMSRFGKRFRKKLIQKWLHGRPGIVGGQFAKGKHIQGFAAGSSVGDLRTVLKVSRILRTHVEGATITPKAGGFLYLSKKTGKAGRGKIVARVKQVKEPARIPFVPMANEEIRTDLIPHIWDATQRAMRVSMERRMKRVGQFFQQVANL